MTTRDQEISAVILADNFRISTSEACSDLCQYRNVINNDQESKQLSLFIRVLYVPKVTNSDIHIDIY